MTRIAVGDQTPWDRADYVEHLPIPGTDDVLSCVSTAGHGGIYVPASVLGRIPAKEQVFAAKWAHGFGRQWFEEDVAAASVVLAFPECFPRHGAAARADMRRELDQALARAGL